MTKELDIDFVWNEYRISLKRFLSSKLSKPEDVDDLLQDVLLKIHVNLDSINSSEGLKSWLFQIANNTINDFYRKAGRRSGELKEEDLWYSEDVPSVSSELSECVRPFIDTLDPEQAALLSAIDIEGIPQKEYAEQIGVSYSTLKSRVQKSRQLLRERFEECCNFSLNRKGNITDYQELNQSSCIPGKQCD